MKKKLLLILLFVLAKFSFSQELNCQVEVNSDQIQGSDKSVFENLQKRVFEFMNNRKWTTEVFSNQERIECTILINIGERVSNNRYKSTITVQSRRPIFNTSYNSTMLNHVDKEFEFEFNEFEPIDFSENSHLNNLSSVLGYYAYLIIGLDYDSFEKEGGTKYLRKAQKIVNNAQGAQEAGWKAFEGLDNRYWIIENWLNQTYKPLRACWYDYHRLGFDAMASKVPESRAKVLESLKQLETVYNQYPTSFMLQMFFNAKSDECVKLFQGGFPSEKAEAYNLLSKLNPGNLTKYEKIKK